MLATVNNDSIQQAQPITADVFTAWANFIDASPRTVETYTRAVSKFYNFMQGRPNPTAPTRADVIAFREELKERGLKATTIQNYITAVRIFFTWTAQENIYPNVADHVKGAKVGNAHKRDYLTGDQLKNVLEQIDTGNIKGLRDFAIISLMATSGLRDIEVSRANIEDLRTLGADVVLYVQGKGKQEKADYVKVAPRAEKAIRLYLRERNAKEASEPLFTSIAHRNQGERMTTRSISRLVKNRLVAAGFNSDRLTAHSLRHTAVTLARLSGEDIEEVQSFARHANIATTLIYDHAIDKSRNTCAVSVENMIYG